MIIANRKQLLNGNSFILGVSGSGKSFTAKREIVNLVLSNDDDIILIDPQLKHRKRLVSTRTSRYLFTLKASI